MSASAPPRHDGLVLIVLLLFAAIVVVPGIRGLTVAGIAAVSPVPGSPAVGDCVLEPVDPSWDDPGAADHGGNGSSAATYSYPRLLTGPCRGPRYGEVTSVTPTSTEPVMRVSSDGTWVNDARVDSCAPSAARYIGIAMTGIQRAPLPGGWYPTQTVEAAATLPSIRQAAAGQKWLACIAYLGASSANPQAVADQERYDGPLHDAMSTGRQRNRIGTCAVGADLTGGELGLVGCGAAHRSEIFASGGSGTHSLSRAELQRSCNQIAKSLTGIGDLTAAGFTVQVLAVDSKGAPVTSASIPAEVNLSCGATANNGRKLDGSLLALGRQPIPWV